FGIIRELTRPCKTNQASKMMSETKPTMPEVSIYEEIGLPRLTDDEEHAEPIRFETTPRLDKTMLQVTTLTDEDEERLYWQQQTPMQRLMALEQMRQIIYGYDPATTRLQRVFAIIDRT
ncbi:MAG: hypothetical protein KDD89_14050, partial [Anaerolineales bacterium]|nr:hypothetical protein [Anaerolineales bacterium]